MDRIQQGNCMDNTVYQMHKDYRYISFANGDRSVLLHFKCMGNTVRQIYTNIDALLALMETRELCNTSKAVKIIMELVIANGDFEAHDDSLK